jgi:hypothetical protein
MTEHWLLQVKWGDVPAWIGALLTGTSLLIAAISYRRSVLDKERDQASKVAAWIALVDEDGQQKRVLRISNGSDASVYDLTCKPANERQISLQELPAKAVTTVNLRGAGPSPKMTKQSGGGVKFLGISMEPTITSEVFSQEPSPEIEFCDALGRWWRRLPGGEVERIKSRARTTTRTVTKSTLLGLKEESQRSSSNPERSSDAGSVERDGTSGQL